MDSQWQSKSSGTFGVAQTLLSKVQNSLEELREAEQGEALDALEDALAEFSLHVQASARQLAELQHSLASEKSRGESLEEELCQLQEALDEERRAAKSEIEMLKAKVLELTSECQELVNCQDEPKAPDQTEALARKLQFLEVKLSEAEADARREREGARLLRTDLATQAAENNRLTGLLGEKTGEVLQCQVELKEASIAIKRFQAIEVEREACLLALQQELSRALSEPQLEEQPPSLAEVQHEMATGPCCANCRALIKSDESLVSETGSTCAPSTLVAVRAQPEDDFGLFANVPLQESPKKRAALALKATAHAAAAARRLRKKGTRRTAEEPQPELPAVQELTEQALAEWTAAQDREASRRSKTPKPDEGCQMQ